MAVLFAGPAASIAAPMKVAVWADGTIPDGGNQVDDFINSRFGAGSAVLVTTADLATPGFLSGGGFTAVFTTRNDAGFGSGLSAAAVANVKAFVGTFGSGSQGTIVLFPNDWADMLGPAPLETLDTRVEDLVANAVKFASDSGHGYVGEFNGAVMAVTANANGFLPLDLLPGSAGALSNFSDALETVSLTVFGTGHPVTAGVAFPFNPNQSFDFRSNITGLPFGSVLATYEDGVPAIISINQLNIPEPATLALCGLIGAGLVGYRLRRRGKLVVA